MAPSFDDYYRQVTGQHPFAWQSRLAQVVQATSWPAYISLPTAAGKTSLVEIWAYALAQAAGQGSHPRSIPLRLVWVVDRRIVVDAVAERARRLAQLLQEAKTDPEHPLGDLAQQLRRFGGTAPLAVAQLRGGLAGQRHWVDAPNQPAVLATTVDQVGSRLLFRGYGVSPYQFSLEAGLLACDTLVVVDEAHLSQPFVATALALARLHQQAPDKVASALRVVVMSATLPSGSATDAFVLTPEERLELAPRLAHPKIAELRTAEDAESFARSLAAAARDCLEATGSGVTAVITNRVDTARETFSLLQREYEAVLLTGRIRPYDRDQVLERWLPKLRAGREPDTGAPPRVVVATQTVEVGADFDFDALVTELAPFSALRQRLGRLNRLGIHPQAQAIVVQRNTEDGVYPYEVVKQVWKWLLSHAHAPKQGGIPSIDVSDDAVTHLLAAGETPPDVAVTEAPLLTRTHADAWAYTSPIPDPDPSVSPFLHGKVEPSLAEVQLVWRADVGAKELTHAQQDEVTRTQIEQRLTAQLDLAPPRVEEALALPIWSVRRWLAGIPDTDAIADVEGSPEARHERPTAETETRYAVRWDGEDATIVSPTHIRPGDTLVIPVTYGGADAFGWLPSSTRPVRDVGDLAGRTGRDGRSRQRLRLHPLVLSSMLVDGEDVAPWVGALESMLDILDVDLNPDSEAAQEDFTEALKDFIALLLPHTLTDGHEALVSWQRSLGQWMPYPIDQAATRKRPPGVVLIWREIAHEDRSADEAVSDAEDQSSMVGIGRNRSPHPVTLREHSEAVAACVREWAVACGIPDELQYTLEWAGRFHDLGKCDPRFQVMLHGGDQAAYAAAREPLAKSGMDPFDRTLQNAAHRLSRLPAQFRHEALSARFLLNSYADLPPEVDRSLLCYLVGTHHGRGRPWLPIVDDREPAEVVATMAGYMFRGSSATDLHRIDSGWPDLVAGLQRRYGLWGLSYLEALLRLADHWVSSQEALV